MKVGRAIINMTTIIMSTSDQRMSIGNLWYNEGYKHQNERRNNEGPRIKDEYDG